MFSFEFNGMASVALKLYRAEAKKPPNAAELFNMPEQNGAEFRKKLEPSLLTLIRLGIQG